MPRSLFTTPLETSGTASTSAPIGRFALGKPHDMPRTSSFGIVRRNPTRTGFVLLYLDEAGQWVPNKSAARRTTYGRASELARRHNAGLVHFA